MSLQPGDTFEAPDWKTVQDRFDLSETTWQHAKGEILAEILNRLTDNWSLAIPPGTVGTVVLGEPYLLDGDLVRSPWIEWANGTMLVLPKPMFPCIPEMPRWDAVLKRTPRPPTQDIFELEPKEFGLWTDHDPEMALARVLYDRDIADSPDEAIHKADVIAKDMAEVRVFLATREDLD